MLEASRLLQTRSACSKDSEEVLCMRSLPDCILGEPAPSIPDRICLASLLIDKIRCMAEKNIYHHDLCSDNVVFPNHGTSVDTVARCFEDSIALATTQQKTSGIVTEYLTVEGPGVPLTRTCLISSLHGAISQCLSLYSRLPIGLC